ncbi:MAG: DnaJ C-terminal domain-containing protein, partial [bacterium]
SDQTQLRFFSKGNEAEGHNPSALVIKFKQTSHSNYNRKGNDLIYTHKITLEEALLSQPVKIKALDGRVIIVTVDEIITP